MLNLDFAAMTLQHSDKIYCLHVKYINYTKIRYVQIYCSNILFKDRLDYHRLDYDPRCVVG